MIFKYGLVSKEHSKNSGKYEYEFRKKHKKCCDFNTLVPYLGWVLFISALLQLKRIDSTDQANQIAEKPL